MGRKKAVLNDETLKQRVALADSIIGNFFTKGWHPDTIRDASNYIALRESDKKEAESEKNEIILEGENSENQ